MIQQRNNIWQQQFLQLMNLLSGELTNSFRPHIEKLFVSGCFRKYQIKMSESFKTNIQVMYYYDKIIQQTGIIQVQDGHQLIFRQYGNFESLLRVLAIKKLMTTQKVFKFTKQLLGVDAIIFKNAYLSQQENLLKLQQLIQSIKLVKSINLAMIINKFMKLINTWHDLNIAHGRLALQDLYVNKRLEPVILPSKFSQLIQQSINQSTNLSDILPEFKNYLINLYPNQQSINLYIHDQLKLNKQLKILKQKLIQKQDRLSEQRIDQPFAEYKYQTKTFKQIQSLICLSFAFGQSYYDFSFFFKAKSQRTNISQQIKQILIQYYNDAGLYESIRQFFQDSSQNWGEKIHVLIYKVNKVQFFKNIPENPALQWSQIILDHPQLFFHQKQKWIRHLQQYVKLLKQINHPKIKFKLQFYQSKLLDAKGYLHRNFNILVKMLQQHTQFNQRVWILNQIGRMCGQIGQNQRAQKYFLKCLSECSQKYGSIYFKNIPTIINLACLYIKMGKLDKVKEYCQRIKMIKILHQDQENNSQIFTQKMGNLMKYIYQQSGNLGQFQMNSDPNSMKMRRGTILQEAKEFLKHFEKQSSTDLKYLQYLIDNVQVLDKPLFLKLLYCKALIKQDQAQSNSFMDYLLDYYEKLEMEQTVSLIRQDFLKINQNDESLLFEKYRQLAINNQLQGSYLLQYAKICFKKQQYDQSLKCSLKFLAKNPFDKLSYEIAIKCYIKHHNYQQAQKLMKEKSKLFQSNQLFLLCCSKLGENLNAVKKWRQMTKKKIKIQNIQVYDCLAQSYLQLKDTQDISTIQITSFLKEFQTYCNKQEQKPPCSFYQLKLQFFKLAKEQKELLIQQIIKTNKNYYTKSAQDAAKLLNNCLQLIKAQDQNWVILFEKIITNEYCIQHWQTFKKVIKSAKWKRENINQLIRVMIKLQNYNGWQSDQFKYTLLRLSEFYEKQGENLKLLITLTRLVEVDKSNSLLKGKIIQLFCEEQIRDHFHKNNNQLLEELKPIQWTNKIFKVYCRISTKYCTILQMCKKLEQDFDVQKLFHVQDQIDVFQVDCLQHFRDELPLLIQLKQRLSSISIQ